MGIFVVMISVMHTEPQSTGTPECLDISPDDQTPTPSYSQDVELEVILIDDNDDDPSQVNIRDVCQIFPVFLNIFIFVLLFF